MWKFQLFLFLIFISCNQTSNEQPNAAGKPNSTNTEIQDTKKQVGNETDQQIETPPEESVLALILPESEDGNQHLEENIPLIFSLLDGSIQDYEIVEEEEEDNVELQLVAFRPGSWFKRKKVSAQPKHKSEIPQKR